MAITTSGILQLLTSRDKPGAFYVFDSVALMDNISKLHWEFSSRYSNFSIAYSFKTNYLKKICDLVRSFGGRAEVVSPEEYAYARRIGFQHKDIVYNGVIPDERKAFDALLGAKVNVDSLDAFRRMERGAEDIFLNRPIPVGVRLNFDIGNGIVSRFGVDIDGEEYHELMNAISENYRFSFKGFQCHIGCGRPARYWKEKAKKMVDQAVLYGASYIDVGGGMYGPMEEDLAKQFDGYSGYDEYAEAVCAEVDSKFPDHSLELIIEPGTALVGNTMHVVATVTGVKEVRGQTYITVDCCSNQLGVICDVKDIPARVIGDSKGPEVNDAIIAGNTCLEFDYLKKGFSGRVEVGDRILFSNVGAYSIGASRQFITPRIPVVDYLTCKTLRSKEGFYEMFKLYMLEGAENPGFLFD